ncbi:MAG: hypothetical protein RIB54_08010 [Fulvivirga sp.]|uniref:hypothetical protein n=2 Tax=Fulvivirga sp. TaxID=1931237 RepID=UPI0032EB30C7
MIRIKKKVFITKLILLLALNLSGQNLIDPKIVILVDSNINFKKGIEKQLDFFTKYGIDAQRDYFIDKKDSLTQLNNKASVSLNNYEFFKNQINTSCNLNFSSYIGLRYAQILQNYLSHYLPNCLSIYQSEQKPFLKDSLAVFSKTNSSNFIILISNIEVNRSKENLLINVKFQLYDSSIDEIIEIPNHSVGSYNSNILTGNNKTLEILFNDVYSISNITRIVKENGNSKERNQKNERRRILMNLFDKGKKNQELSSLIPSDTSLLGNSSYYTGIFNASKNQFLTFYIKDGDFKIQEYRYPQCVEIVCGIKTENNWEIKRISKILRPEISSHEEVMKEIFLNLENIYFFEENSSQINSEFWALKLFDKYSVRFGL